MERRHLVQSLSRGSDANRTVTSEEARLHIRAGIETLKKQES